MLATGTAWRTAAIVLPQVAGAASITAVPVLLAVNESVEAAAWALTTASLGVVAGSLAATHALARIAALTRGRSAAATLIAAWIGITVILLAVTSRTPVPLPAVLTLTAMTGFTWAAVAVMNRTVIGTWGSVWLRRAGPLGRVGAAIGALVGAWAATSPLGAGVLLPGLAAVLLSPALIRPAASDRSVHTWNWAVFTSNFTLAAVGYGPVVLQVAFVAATAGPAWAGVSMAVYAAFALAAPRLAHALPRSLHATPTGWLLLAAAANASWLLVVLHPVGGLLAARALSALTLFAAEGSADVAAHDTRALGTAFTGRAAGGVTAALLGAAVLAVAGTVPATALILAGIAAAAAATAAVITAVARKRGSRSAVAAT
jgi:hypothetical protein